MLWRCCVQLEKSQGKNASIVVKLMHQQSDEQPCRLFACTGKRRCGKVGDRIGKHFGCLNAFDDWCRVKAKWAKVGFKVALGCRAKELETFQGLWYQGIDRRINFGGVGDPGLTFGWFDLELGGGEGRLP